MQLIAVYSEAGDIDFTVAVATPKLPGAPCAEVKLSPRLLHMMTDWIAAD